MPDTGDFAFPYPAGTDDPDVPADIQALAARIAAINAGAAINRPVQFQRAADPEPVAVLPAAPADDEIVIYRVSATVDWRVIWDATNGRWKKIGGPALTEVDDTLISWDGVAAGYNIPAAPGLVVPRTGVYDVEISSLMWHSGPGRGVMQTFLTRTGVGNTPLGNLTGEYRSLDYDDYKYTTDRRDDVALTAGWDLRILLWGDDVQSRSRQRRITIDPVYLT